MRCQEVAVSKTMKYLSKEKNHEEIFYSNGNKYVTNRKCISLSDTDFSSRR